MKRGKEEERRKREGKRERKVERPMLGVGNRVGLFLFCIIFRVNIELKILFAVNNRIHQTQKSRKKKRQEKQKADLTK